jgi:acetyl esterase/lipase
MRRNGSVDTPGRVRGRWVARLVALVTVVAAVIAAPVGGSAGSATTPVQAAPTVAVTPADDLVDGQTVTVAAAGLTPAVALLCGASPQDVADCDWMAGAAPLEPSADGAASGERPVFALIHTERRGAVDCRVAGSCVVTVASFAGADPLDGSVSAPLTFDPEAPLLPAPAISVTPATGLGDGDAVRVDGHDLAHRGVGGVQILQCGPQPSFATCRSLIDPGVEPPEPGADGTLTYETRVWQVIPADGGDVDCRAEDDPCLIVATTRPRATLDAPWAARAALGFDAAAPPAPDPILDVSPGTALGDVTELAVTGRDFTPAEAVRVSVCEDRPAGPCDRDTHEVPTADADGRFEVRMNAFAAFETDGVDATQVDCRTAGCAVVADALASTRRVTVPLAFGPADPPRGRYFDPVFDELDVERDIVYRQATDSRGDQVDLRLDIYRPAGDTATSRPAVVWMHGGWFTGGDGGGDMAHHAEASARRGYVAVDIGYRVRPELDPRDPAELYAAMVDAYEDATAAVDWVAAHADDHGIDADAIMAGGFSAGAVTTTNLAYMPGQLGPDTSRIAAAIPLEGWFARTDEPGLPAVGPLAVPDPGEPPAIVFHGTADQLLPWGSPADTCPLAADAGIACEYVPYAGGQHGDVYGRIREVMHRATAFVAAEVLAPRGYFDLAVDAGGPYEVTEGSVVTLAGTASGDGLSYAWSPPEHLTGAATPAPGYAGDDDGTETLTLSVRNAHGVAGSDTADVTTVNAPPVLGDVELRVDAGDGALTLNGGLTDPGRTDTHTAEVDWGDGTVEALSVDQEAGAARITGRHAYATGGGRQVTVRVVDDDGGTDTWTGTAADEPACTIEGTDGPDVLVGTSGDDVICGFGGTDIVVGGGGDDVVLAGGGDDLVLGGRGDDAVDAGDGDDVVFGQGGDDRVDGGPGHDRVHGGPGRDTCIAAERRWSCAPTEAAARGTPGEVRGWRS